MPPVGGWRFDALSTLIGAILAWVIAGLLYARREALKALVNNVRTRIQRLGGRLQASQEERYLHALQEALRHLLLFNPRDPPAVFMPPTFTAPAPLPKMPDPDGELPPPQRITFDNLLKGHSRLIISGRQTSGRTTTLAMTVWSIAMSDEEDTQKVFSRFPVWIDLRDWTPEADDVDKDEESSPMERLAELAVQFFPQAMPKFIAENLQKQPSLILVDNWEVITQENRRKVAQFIDEAAQQLPDSLWIVAAGPSAHGPLVEKQFVPLQIVPPSPEDIFTDLYIQWAKLLGEEDEDIEIPDNIYYALQWAALTQAPLPELTLRIVLYLRAQQAPERPIDVMETLLEGMVPMPKRGGDEVAEQVRDLTMMLLGHLARTARVEGEHLTKNRREDYINNTLLPPEDERPPRLESQLTKTLQRARILRQDGDIWTFAHYVWEDFFCAWALAQDPEGLSVLGLHLYDPAWTFLFECYVGLGDATSLVQDLVQKVLNTKEKKDILRAARWAMIVPEDNAAADAWRKVVMKGLAQTFTAAAVPDALRLQIGRALALVAGETARPFFSQALRHSNIDVRAIALRGLGWVGSDREMEILEAALLGKDVEIQHNAALALAELGTTEALRILYQGLSQSDERVMLTISEALAETPEGWEMLKEAAESADLLVRRSAAHGLARVKQPWAADILVRMLREDPEWLVQSAANAALQAHTAEDKDTTTVAPPPDITQLAWLKAWAAKHKWSVKTEEDALKILARAAEDDAPTTRMMVAYTLAYIGRWDHMPVLNELLTDMEPAVRNAAAQALGWVEDRYELGRRER